MDTNITKYSNYTTKVCVGQRTPLQITMKIAVLKHRQYFTRCFKKQPVAIWFNLVHLFLSSFDQITPSKFLLFFWQYNITMPHIDGLILVNVSTKLGKLIDDYFKRLFVFLTHKTQLLGDRQDSSLTALGVHAQRIKPNSTDRFEKNMLR